MAIRMGADYYPEHWDKERWAVDARLMRENGLNTVRMAEFAWSKLEKRRGEFDFGWLDAVIETLGAQGVDTVLCTPTATPPKWLCDEEDVFQRDGYGQARAFGSRRHYCYNNPDYRVETARIVTAMAAHYREHPHVIAWQIDNEFGCHDTARCYCKHCLRAFQSWLKKKYKTVERLNEEWGLIFWSQSITDFDQVWLPAYTTMENPNRREFPHNPGLLLDYFRFSSDSAVAYQKFQIDLLRANGVHVPITHNLMGHVPFIDYYKLARDLDFTSWDNYPLFPFQKNDYRNDAMAHDLMRSTKHENFWVMEHQCGPGGTCVEGDLPKPGQIRLWTYASLAHGAKAILYFRWRACTFGNEQYWLGILGHDGIPRRRYREIGGICKELEKFGRIFTDGQNKPAVAIVKSYDALWSQEIQWHNPKFDYNRFVAAYYNGLLDNNVNCDIIELHEPFEAYKLVVMPAVVLMTEELAKKTREYVQRGGTVVLTFRCGIKTWNNSMTMKPLPGLFSEMAGLTVGEFDSLNTDRKNRIDGTFGAGEINMWCDLIETQSAEVLSRYSKDFYAGMPAVTRNRYGKGTVYYVGCDLDAGAQRRFTAQVLRETEVKPLNEAARDGVELVEKLLNGARYLIFLNHTGAAVSMPLSFEGKELLSAQRVSGTITLDAYGVAIVKTEP